MSIHNENNYQLSPQHFQKDVKTEKNPVTGLFQSVMNFVGLGPKLPTSLPVAPLDLDQKKLIDLENLLRSESSKIDKGAQNSYESGVAVGRQATPHLNNLVSIQSGQDKIFQYAQQIHQEGFGITYLAGLIDGAFQGSNKEVAATALRVSRKQVEKDLFIPKLLVERRAEYLVAKRQRLFH